MHTELKLENIAFMRFPYLRYIVIILLVGLFSFWAFPGQSSIGQPDKIVVKPPSNAPSQNIDFMDEKEIRQLKQHPTGNNMGDNKPEEELPALSESVMASKFIRQGSTDVNQVAITFDDEPCY